MSEFTNNEIKEKVDFGDYVNIEVMVYGFENQWFLHKVIGSFRSNSWIETPLRWNSQSVLHDTVETVLNVVKCGIDETKVIQVRKDDCKIIKRNH